MSYRKSYPNLSFESRLIMMEGDEFDAESDYLNNQYRNQKNYSGIVTPAKISSQGPNGNATSGNPMSRVRLDFPVYPDEAELKEGDQRYIRHDLDPFLNPTGDTGDQDPIQTGAKVNLKSVGNDPAYNGKTNNLRVQFGSVGNSAGLQSLAGANVGIANLNFGGGSPVPPTDYRSRNSPRAPTPAQLSAANSLGVEYQVIQAIEAVESGGNPAAVRFEPHLWHRKYREFGLTDAQRDQMPFTPNAQVPFSKVASETNEAAFDKAMTISPALAVYSTSFGLYQVMGYNFADYKNTAEQKVKDFRANPEGASYELLLKWFEGNPKAIQAAKDKDFMLLARYYNGPANVNVYGPRMSKEYEAFSGGGSVA